MLALQQTAIRQIIPMYRALQDREQIELTTTVFPPDSSPGHRFRNSRAAPDRTFRCPARFHARPMRRHRCGARSNTIRRYSGGHRSGSGRPEGSVCPEVLPIVSTAGIRWLATDEGILYRSLQMAGQAWNRHYHLYQPYKVGTDAQPCRCCFVIARSQTPSDSFYPKTTPESAADDVLRRIRSLAL